MWIPVLLHCCWRVCSLFTPTHCLIQQCRTMATPVPWMPCYIPRCVLFTSSSCTSSRESKDVCVWLNISIRYNSSAWGCHHMQPHMCVSFFSIGLKVWFFFVCTITARRCGVVFFVCLGPLMCCILDFWLPTPSPRTLRPSCLKLEMNEFRCYEAKKRGKWKGWQPPGVEPRTAGLSCQCSATEPRQPDNYQPSQSSIYAQHGFFPDGDNFPVNP